MRYPWGEGALALMPGVFTNICLPSGLSHLGELETLVMLKKYAYYESSGQFVVVRPLQPSESLLDAGTLLVQLTVTAC